MSSAGEYTNEGSPIELGGQMTRAEALEKFGRYSGGFGIGFGADLL